MHSRSSFFLSETFRNLRYNKFLTLVVVANIAISLFFVSIFATAFLSLNALIESAEKRVTLEVFLSDASEDTISIRRDIVGTPGIESARYISKEEAYDIFIREMGRDILTAVEGNPLPASYKCAILPEYRTPERLAILRNSLKGIRSVEEVSEIRGYVPALQKVRRVFAAVSLATVVVLFLTIFFTVFSTIRLAYHSRKEHIRVMALVGAPEWAIKVPFLLGGAIQGFLGGFLASLFLLLTLFFLRSYFPAIVFDWRLLPFLTGLGLLLGAMASFRSIPSEEHV